jgi:hypothetical protein
MRNARTKTIESSQSSFDMGRGCVGRIVGVAPTGQPLVDFPRNPALPVAARMLIDLDADCRDAEVFLLFEEGDPSLPIIAGLLRDTVELKKTVAHTALPDGAPREVVVDARVVVLDAEREIELRCGKSSIVLRADGTVVIKGTRLLSRSSGPNKIKGASVQIN